MKPTPTPEIPVEMVLSALDDYKAKSSKTIVSGSDFGSGFRAGYLAALSVPAAAVVGEPVGDVAYNAGLEIRYAIAASGVDPIQHIPEVDAIIERRLAEARKAAFREAAEIAEDRMPVIQCMSVEPIVSACMEIATAIRAKAEETRA